MAEATERTVTVDNPKRMRALAHPLRLKILGTLRMDGPRSVGQLAELLGQAPGSISYHLSTLAASGFVLEAPELARDARERWWRTAHASTRLEPARLRENPAQQGAAVALRQSILQAYLAEQLQALEAEATLDADWLEASRWGDVFARLTLEEFRDFSAEIAAVVDRWSERGDEPRDGTRVVRAIFTTFPRP